MGPLSALAPQCALKLYGAPPSLPLAEIRTEGAGSVEGTETLCQLHGGEAHKPQPIPKSRLGDLGEPSLSGTEEETTPRISVTWPRSHSRTKIGAHATEMKASFIPAASQNRGGRKADHSPAAALLSWWDAPHPLSLFATGSPFRHSWQDTPTWGSYWIERLLMSQAQV